MPKNVMCKKCNNLINGWCEKKIDSPDPDMVRDCQYFWEKTNADRIRAMSDEELADLLSEGKWKCENYRVCKECPRYIGDCCLPLEEWLKQPQPEPPKEEAKQDCTYNKNGHCMGQKMMPECDPKSCDRKNQ